MVKNFKSLTSYRFIASLLVVLVHYQTFILFPLFPSLQVNRLWMNLFSNAPPIVDFFFVLSGFILAHVYWQYFESDRWTRYWEFLKIRFARVYPLHLLTLGMMVLLFVGMRLSGHSESWFWKYSVRDLVMNLLLIQDWETTRDLTFNRPAWSISSECAFYLVFPVILIGVRRLKGVLTPAALSTLLWGALIAGLWMLGYRNLDRTYHLGLARVAADAPMGMLLYRIYLETSKSVRIYRVLFWVSLAGLILSVILGGFDPWSVPFFALLILSSAVLDDELTGLHSEWLQRWGLASYAIYMTHHFFIRAGDEYFPLRGREGWPLGVRLATVAGYLGITLGVSLWVHLKFENPMRKLILKRRS